jgi:hypothetical protein
VQKEAIASFFVQFAEESSEDLILWRSRTFGVKTLNALQTPIMDDAKDTSAIAVPVSDSCEVESDPLADSKAAIQSLLELCAE